MGELVGTFVGDVLGNKLGFILIEGAKEIVGPAVGTRLKLGVSEGTALGSGSLVFTFKKLKSLHSASILPFCPNILMAIADRYEFGYVLTTADIPTLSYVPSVFVVRSQLLIMVSLANVTHSPTPMDLFIFANIILSSFPFDFFLSIHIFRPS